MPTEWSRLSEPAYQAHAETIANDPGLGELAKARRLSNLLATRSDRPWEPWEDDLLASGETSVYRAAQRLERTYSSVQRRIRTRPYSSPSQRHSKPLNLLG